MILRILHFLYQWLIFVPLFLGITILTAISTMLGCTLGSDRIFAYYPGMLWSRLTCLLALSPVRVKGREQITPDNSYVVMANHQSAFDIFLIYGHLGLLIRWVMKGSLRSIPLVGRACEAAGFIFVDEHSRRGAIRAVEETERCIRTRGGSIMIFPEAERTLTGRLNRFKRGGFQMAIDLQLPILPITLNGPYEVLKRGRSDLHPHRMELVIHEPISTAGLTADNIPALMAETRQTIHAALWSSHQDAQQ